MQDLLGGEDRIDKEASSWGDSFIVNLGTEALEHVTEYIQPRDLDNWHVDGDFFVSIVLTSLIWELIVVARFTTLTLLNKLYSSFQYFQLSNAEEVALLLLQRASN
jgi:hypothetical protein